ncbi:HAD family phosphatase [Algoriphagus sp. CAU 1675]|uniref:HAD family hydrolase n=1 Tax=Algoriphagus sp. CAU 1675 TaxID=3032597 RepID=UPI0023D9DB83|nr:HAD family phosphatase [Algoriphagus sp. CAU 1675]MDF2158118.1 HAD family phosphatase [Algoriphagus sp. CAU 1675]
MKKSPDVDFLIFDLGNVIVDIDYQRALDLIKAELPLHIHEKVDKFYLTDFHLAYEKGLIDSNTFRSEVNQYFEQDWEDEKVDQLWNNLLGKIPAERLDLVKKLRNFYQVGVLSNTNLVHIHGVNEILQRDHGIKNFDPIFDWVFFSHEMGLAKPQPEIYEKMLSDLKTTPDRVMFFDDLEANVRGAESVGIQAVHVTGPEVIFDYLKHV